MKKTNKKISGISNIQFSGLRVSLSQKKQAEEMVKRAQGYFTPEAKIRLTFSTSGIFILGNFNVQTSRATITQTAQGQTIQEVSAKLFNQITCQVNQSLAPELPPLMPITLSWPN